MKAITLSNIKVHNYGARAGSNLSCMSGGYPDAQYNGEADAYGIWARGVDGLKLKCLDFYDDGASRRKKFVFDASVVNVGSSAINDCSTAIRPAQGKFGRIESDSKDFTQEAFDAWGRRLPDRFPCGRDVVQ